MAFFAHLRAAIVVLSACAVGACAARGATMQATQELGAAESLLRDGCYTCLRQALSTYERLAQGPRPSLDAQRGAFNASLLLAVRAKELGFPEKPFLERARAYASRLPPVTPPTLTPSAYLDAAELFVGEVSGFDPDARSERSQRLRRPVDAPRPPARAALSAAAPTDLIAEYLGLAIDCEDARARREIDAAEVSARHGGVGLIQFRLALCAVGTTPARVRESDSRWLDALFFEGRAEMTRRPIADVATAETFFHEASAAFPESNAIVLALGAARNALGDYEAALADFDSVLSREPGHRDALIGRVMSLSYRASRRGHRHRDRDHRSRYVADWRCLLLAGVESLPGEGTRNGMNRRRAGDEAEYRHEHVYIGRLHRLRSQGPRHLDREVRSRIRSTRRIAKRSGRPVSSTWTSSSGRPPLRSFQRR